MKYAGLTDIGQHRLENQDSFSVKRLSDTAVLAIVCDGMGGAAGGKIASSLALSSFESFVIAKIAEKNISLSDKSEENLAILEEILKEGTKVANCEVFGYAKDSIDLLGMGTTLVSCLCIDSHCLICNVGDSRLYHITEHAMRQVTRDHSYVQMLVDTGTLAPEYARVHPDRNIIVRAIGTRPGVTAETFRLSLSENETLLLCSDGLSDYVSNEDMYTILWGSQARFLRDENEKVKDLIAAANNGGGRDNITAVILTY